MLSAHTHTHNDFCVNILSAHKSRGVRHKSPGGLQQPQATEHGHEHEQITPRFNASPVDAGLPWVFMCLYACACEPVCASVCVCVCTQFIII